jgi:hypothetical protein
MQISAACLCSEAFYINPALMKQFVTCAAGANPKPFGRKQIFSREKLFTSLSGTNSEKEPLLMLAHIVPTCCKYLHTTVLTVSVAETS